MSAEPLLTSPGRVVITPAATSTRRGGVVSWPLLVALVGFLAPVVMGHGLGDSDTYLHISIGRWMFAHGQILMRDPFSFTRHGAAVTSQEWGSDLLIAAAFRVAGWSGLVLLSAACFAATLGYLTRFLAARMEPVHALLLSVLAAFMMYPSLLARPHALVWPLTAVWVGTLVRCSEDGRAPPWWLLGVMLLWVNMHGSFIIAPGIALFLALDSCLAARKRRWDIGRRWLWFSLAAFAVEFLNPQGYHLVLFPLHLLNVKALSLMAEWRPPSFEHLQIFGLWIIIVVGLALFGRIRLSLARTLVMLALFYTALQHNRNIALLGLISPFLLAAPVAALWREVPVPGRQAGAVDRWFGSLVSPARYSTISLALGMAGAAAIAVLYLRQPRPPSYARPRAALDAVLACAHGGRILNDPDFGDYLIYRGVPDFMDDRVELYGNAFITRTADALDLSPRGHLRALLRQYKIDAIVLQAWWPAVRLLARLPGWKRVYADKVAVAYVRRDVEKS